MFVHGLHRVGEVRETADEADVITGVMVLLTAENTGSSLIIVSFTDRADVSLSLIRLRPNPLIQYSRPRNDLGEFLATFPLGSLVSSSLTVPSGGKPSLRLTLTDDSYFIPRDGGVRDLVATGPVSNKSAAPGAFSVDSKLEGTWTNSGRTYEFRPNGSYFVHDTQMFQLLNGGANLDWGGLVFDRLSGNTAEVSGHWLSEAGDEDVLLRGDSTYTWHALGEFPDAIGEWEVSGSSLSSRELRAYVSTTGDQITFDTVFGGSETATFAFSNGDRTLTVSFSGLTVIYTRP